MSKYIGAASFNKSFDPENPQDIFNLLISEIKEKNLSQKLKNILEALPREIRKEIVKKDRDKEHGCPLFLAAKIGYVDAIEFLVTVCEANLEQRGLYEVTEERTVHFCSSLWVASVVGNLAAVKCLIRLGADINSQSDSGSSSVRSACFMTHLEIVECLISSGADFKLANYNGGTCLINSVQSIALCNYLIKKGADVNAKDIQNKTALHYAIQEHRLDCTKLLLENGANPFTKSRYGDDALQTACLKGAFPIFDYLKSKIYYTPERIVNAYELIGSTMLDDHHHINESRVMACWRFALDIRLRENLPKPFIPLRNAFNNTKEFSTIEELNNISLDIDAMRIQSLLISERILGIMHKDMLFRLLFRGAALADSLRFENCLYLWILSLEIRIEKNSILHSDTAFVAQAIVRLMLNLNQKDIDFVQYEFNEILPAFSDIYKVFQLLTEDIKEARELLSVRPIYKKQQENFDKILKCVTHLIYLMISTVKNEDELHKVHVGVYKLIKNDIRSSTKDTMLHMSVSRLNSVKHGYFSEANNQNKSVFPNIAVVKLLLKCDSDVNARNDCQSSPLFIASIPYNYNFELIECLLNSGAHLDQPNKVFDRPLNLIRDNPLNNIPIMNYTTLKCLAATTLIKYKIPYKNQIPKTLETFVKSHESH